MLYYESPVKDPYYNLALEEYLFEHFKEDTVFFLWQNTNTIVIGKYQNPMEEINQSYVKEHNIHVARRLSGGGAVYHDAGNLNFTFVEDASKNPDFNFQLFIRPVVKTLERFGIHAEFNGRNDITIDGAKFSGNSQYYKHQRVLHHGCIMLDSNLDVVSQALKPKEAKFESKSVKSVRGRVTSINRHAPTPIDMDTFKKAFVDCMGDDYPLKEIRFTEEDMIQIQKIRNEKYSTWDWIYGHTPDYNMHVEKKFPSGLVSAYIQTKNNTIEHIRFYGDFFSKKDISELEENLCGLKLDDKIAEQLEAFDISEYINGITARELSELFL